MTEGESARARVWSWARSRADTIALYAIVAASLVFRLHVSRECSLWFDEAATVRDCYAPWRELLFGPSREHPPLMFWLVRLTTEILGRSDTAVRSTSLLFGCALLIGTYRLCRELQFSAPRSLFVVASLALTPFFSRHAVEARQYAMTAALITWGTVFLLRLLREPLRPRPLVGLAVCSVAAAATHFFALPYALALWGALLLGKARELRPSALARRERMAVALTLGCTLLLLGLVAARLAVVTYWYTTHALGGRVHHFSHHGLWRTFSFLVKPSFAPELEAVVAACGLLLIAARRRNLGGLIPLLLTFPPVAVASLLKSGHALAPRYLAPSFPFYHLGEVALLFGVLDLIEPAVARAPVLVRRLVPLAAIFLLVPIGLRLKQYPAGFGAGQVYYRGLQEYFEGRRARDTALVVFVGYAGLRIMGTQYPVPHLMSLEEFEPIPGIDRYVIAEFSSGDARLSARFGPLLARHFGLSVAQWRAIRPLRLPATRYQRAVRARLVRLERSKALENEHSGPESESEAAPKEGDAAHGGDSDED